MSLIVAMAAFSIDVGQWYVGRHHAQVTADATALAAANCLASTKCTTTTDTAGSDTETAGNKIANDDGFSASSISYAFSTSNSTVTVTVHSSTPAAFGRLFGIQSANTSATATASYYTRTPTSNSCVVTGAANCYSLFAGNDTCPSSSSTTNKNIPSDFWGLDLVTNDSGGGNGGMSEVFSNAYFMSKANSSAITFVVTTVGTGSPEGPACAESPGSSKSTYQYVPAVLPYPEVWTEPTGTQCTFSAASWTTTSIKADGPGVFCVNTTPTGTCKDAGTAAGDIDVDMSSLKAGGYEFVGPCVTIAGQSTIATNISGQPLVYGTSNIAQTGSTTDFATSTALPTCVKSDGTNLTSTFLDGNPKQAPTIYDQCGTVEVTQNGGYTGFVEAWNISIDKNNAVTGNGPTSVTGASGPALPGGDALIG